MNEVIEAVRAKLSSFDRGIASQFAEGLSAAIEKYLVEIEEQATESTTSISRTRNLLHLRRISTGHEIHALSLSPDGLRIGLSLDGGHIFAPIERRLEMRSAGDGRFINQHTPVPYSAIAVRPTADWKYSVSSSQRGRIDLLSLAGDRNDLNLRGHDEPINAIKFASDSRLMASLDQGGAFRLWDLGLGRTLRKWNMFERKTRIELSPDGTKIAVMNSNALRVVDTHTGRWIFKWARIHEDSLGPLAFDPSAEKLFWMDLDGSLHATSFDKDAQPVFQLKTNPLVRSLVFSSDGRFLALAWVNHLAIFDTDSREIVFEKELGGERISHMIFTLDGSKIILTTNKGDILFQDLPEEFRSDPTRMRRLEELKALWSSQPLEFPHIRLHRRVLNWLGAWMW